MSSVDATVIGSGPNGLAAAVTLARAGLKVKVYELGDSIGGGARTSTLPDKGYRYDSCSAVHPMALASPFFADFQLERRVEFLVPEVSYGHALAPTRCGLAFRDLRATADRLGVDGSGWLRLFTPLVDQISNITDLALDQLIQVPAHPISAVQFGLKVLEQGTGLWNRRFSEDVAPALLTGVNAHSVGRMPSLSTAGAGLILATLAHVRGWPIPVGGSQSIVDAMAADLLDHGGQIVTNLEISSLAQLPGSKAVLFDTSARAMIEIAGPLLPQRYRQRVHSFTYGNAASKVDFALSEPIPWRSSELLLTPTIHIGGDRAALARSEQELAYGHHPTQPYILLSQPSLFDSSRTPTGKHVAWTYTHVPRNSQKDMSDAICRRIEEFAPGFKDTIEEVHVTTATQMETYNPNYIGGDFSSGAVSLKQLLKRPVLSRHPWSTPSKGLYLCSSSTPPGPGVHGMCGWRAAVTALAEVFHLDPPSLALEAPKGRAYRTAK